MSIIKRKNSPYWWYSFSIDGTRFRGSTFTADKKLAGEYETKARNEAYSRRKLGKKPNITLEKVLAKYWKEHAQIQNWSPSVTGYMKNFMIAWGANTHLSEINDAQYSDLVSYLKKKKLKPGTINRHMNCFRKVYRLTRDSWGYEVGKINFALHRLKEPDSRIRYLTTEEASTLIDQAAPHLKPIIRFALYTGARRSNILNLKWRDVDMVGRRINIKVKSDLPGGKNHVIEMVDGLFDLLKQQKGVHPVYVFTHKGKPIGSPKTAFKTARGFMRVIDSKTGRKKWEPNPEKQIIPDFRFHDLRHTCASWLVQDGAQLAIVRDILGHSTSKMTEKYAHHDKTQKLSAMQHTFKGRVGI